MSQHYMGYLGGTEIAHMLLVDQHDSQLIGSFVNTFSSGGGNRLLAEFYFVRGHKCGPADLADDNFWTLQVFNAKGPTEISVVEGCPHDIRSAYVQSFQESPQEQWKKERGLG